MRDAIATRRSRRLMLVAVGLLAAAAVLPLLVPPSAGAWELLSLEARLALEGHGDQLREGLNSRSLSAADPRVVGRPTRASDSGKRDARIQAKARAAPNPEVSWPLLDV